SSKVDLPMPGSPPTNTTEPSTRPPPSTRSNSPMPVDTRVSLVRLTSRNGVTSAPPPSPAQPPWRVDCLPALADSITNSLSVFHASHSPHWPCHLLKLAPQSAQT